MDGHAWQVDPGHGTAMETAVLGSGTCAAGGSRSGAGRGADDRWLRLREFGQWGSARNQGSNAGTGAWRCRPELGCAWLGREDKARTERRGGGGGGGGGRFWNCDKK